MLITRDALVLVLVLDVLSGAALAAEPRESALLSAPVLNPSPKQLVITESPNARSVSRIKDVKNATVVIDTRSNYIKGLSLRRLRSLRKMPLQVVLGDAIGKKHVRQVLFLGSPDIALRVSERFIEDEHLVARLHEFGPVRLELDTPPAIALQPAFWKRLGMLKRTSMLVRLEEDQLADEKLGKTLASRPAAVSLTLAVHGVPEAEVLKALLRARPDRLRMRIDKPEALNWKLIDDLNDTVKVPKIITVSPTSLSDDGVVRLNGVQGVTVRVEGADFLGVDSVLQLNRIGQ